MKLNGTSILEEMVEILTLKNVHQGENMHFFVSVPRVWVFLRKSSTKIETVQNRYNFSTAAIFRVECFQTKISNWMNIFLDLK